MKYYVFKTLSTQAKLKLTSIASFIESRLVDLLSVLKEEQSSHVFESSLKLVDLKRLEINRVIEEHQKFKFAYQSIDGYLKMAKRGYPVHFEHLQKQIIYDDDFIQWIVEKFNVSEEEADMIRRLFEAEVIILPSVDLDIALRQGMAWLNPDININFEAIIDTVSELVRHGVKPKILDITSTLVFYEVGDITIPQFEQLLALLLSERISLPARTIEELRAAQQRGVQIDLQNVVPFTEQEEEKYALQAQQNAEDAGMDMSESEDSDFEENMQELERNGGRSLRNIRGLNAIANIREEIEEQNAERNTAENRARARQIEAENEAKRQAALEEYKTTDMEAQPAEVKVNANCYPASHTTIMGDALKDIDDFVVFLIERSEKGDCYLRSELEEIYARPMAYEFRGAPYGVSVSQNMRNMPRGPDENKPVFKLPWTNIWVTKEAIVEAINTYNNLLILKGKRQSIGSDYGNSMDGQFGGHWREDNGRAVYVESGDAQPDERPIVYRLMRGVYSQL
jgi:hypothetical protein